MTAELQAKIVAALTAHATHGEALNELKTMIDAEVARVPTLEDVKALVARIP